MSTKPLTTEKRAANVDQVNANNALDGLSPTETDKELLQQYVEGKKTAADLLEAARQEAARAQKTQG